MPVQFIEKIKMLGITDNTEIAEVPYISFTNILILIAGLGVLIYIPYLILFLPETGYFLIIGTFQFVFYIAALLCNYLQLYFLSRNILCFTALIFTVMESAVTGFYCDIHLYLMIGVIFAFFVFPEKQRRYSYFISLSFALTYIVIEIIIAFSSTIPLPQIYIMNLKHVIRSTFLIMIFFFAYYSYRSIRRFQVELNTKNLNMVTEISLARNIQQQIIPLKDPAENFYSLYKSMSLLGGDFYDYINFRDSKKIGIFISDVSGHGVPASLITTMIKTAMFQSGSLKENPAELLMYLNDILVQQSGGNFVTAFYGVYNPDDRTMVFSNAGHNFPFIIDSSGVNEVTGGRSIPLAVLGNEDLISSNKAYSNSGITLAEKSKLLFYTDGLIETRSVKNSEIFFEHAGMHELFKEYYNLPCGSFVTALYNDLVTFNGSDNFEDDICMICVDII